MRAGYANRNTHHIRRRLTEEEMYLVAILLDKSGLDIAEFAMPDDQQPDGIYRAWSFQWSWYRDRSPQSIEQGARSTGKSASVKLRMLGFPWSFPGQEAVITGPLEKHVTPLADAVDTAWHSRRLFREFLQKGRGYMTKRPFTLRFINDAKIYGKIPGTKGTGVKGTHPVILELDEGQDFTDKAFKESIETVNKTNPDNQWRVHGVTTGVRNWFWRATQSNSGWKVHRPLAICRPTWTEEERQQKLLDYGGYESPDWRRNVYGDHAGEAVHLFVLARLMKLVAEPDDAYSLNEYHKKRILAENVKGIGEDAFELMGELLDLPMRHTSDGQYVSFVAGMDVGMVADPSEILVFGLTAPEAGKRQRLRLLTRITLVRMSAPRQVDVLIHVIDHYRCLFGMDRTGLGLPLFTDLQERVEMKPSVKPLLKRLKGYNFSEKLAVEIDAEVEEETGSIDDALLKKNTKDAAQDELRHLVDEAVLELPWDEDLIDQFKGQTGTLTKKGTDAYGRIAYSVGEFHALDAARMAALVHGRQKIEAILEERRDRPPVIDVLGF